MRSPGPTNLHVLHIPTRKLQRILLLMTQASLTYSGRLGITAVYSLVRVHAPLEAFLNGSIAQRGNTVRETVGIISDSTRSENVRVSILSLEQPFWAIDDNLRAILLAVVSLPAAVDLEEVVSSGKEAFLDKSVHSIVNVCLVRRASNIVICVEAHDWGASKAIVKCKGTTNQQ